MDSFDNLLINILLIIKSMITTNIHRMINNKILFVKVNPIYLENVNTFFVIIENMMQKIIELIKKLRIRMIRFSSSSFSSI